MIFPLICSQAGIFVLHELMKKLTYLIDGEMVLKYQVVSEDLDTLVSVKSEVDLRHMIDEINLYELAGSPRLRAFLFPVKHCSQVSSASSSPRSAASHTSDAINNTINMLKAQSSPRICGMYTIRPQYNIYQRVDPQRNGGQERLVSAGPVGPGDGMRHHVDPVSQHYYNDARQKHRENLGYELCSFESSLLSCRTEIFDFVVGSLKSSSNVFSIIRDLLFAKFLYSFFLQNK
ncbi:hypothetical protein CASFOL_035690 [Castilleja foliolosa]|uniref:PB1 domain-containing protein n=1 Tax=Castilleja foliolosa TaxID=1961234 RepID=A0ABD3BU77_9LAMI